MTEAQLNKKVVDALNLIPGVFVKKRFAGPTQRGQPDITGIIFMHGFGIRIEMEGKMPGKKLTQIQQHWLATWKRYGALTGVYHSIDEAETIVLSFIKRYVNKER